MWQNSRFLYGLSVNNDFDAMYSGWKHYISTTYLKVRPIAASRDFPAIARLFVGFRTTTASGVLLEMETYWRRSDRWVQAGSVCQATYCQPTSHRYDVLFGPAMTPRCLRLLLVWRTVCLLVFGRILHQVHILLLLITSSGLT